VKLSQNYIPLPLSFDADRLAEELHALPDSAWMKHPSGLEGNSAVPLISVGGGDNDLFQGAMAMTPYLEQSPYHRQVIASFNEVVGRSRHMKIAAGCHLARHVDVEYHWHMRVRVHIPIVTNPGVIFTCDGEEMHMAAGSCWIFNTWLLHRVDNNGTEDRTHLVFDITGSSRFWNMVRKMEGVDPHKDLASQGVKVRHLSYLEGALPKIRTEQFNVTPLLAPGEVEALADNIISEISAGPDNDPDAVEFYKQLIVSYAKDWRQTWLAYGYSKEGWPQFDGLVRGLLNRIENGAPAGILLGSNKTDVREAILKHLIVPAMNFEFLERLSNA